MVGNHLNFLVGFLLNGGLWCRKKAFRNNGARVGKTGDHNIERMNDSNQNNLKDNVNKIHTTRFC